MYAGMILNYIVVYCDRLALLNRVLIFKKVNSCLYKVFQLMIYVRVKTKPLG